MAERSMSIRVATDADHPAAERLIRSTFHMDEARFRLMYERDPRCRPENLYVAVMDGEVVGVNGFREVALDGLFRDGRPSGPGIISGATAIRSEYRLRGISKGIFRQAWGSLGKKYAYCLGFTRPELHAGFLRAIGFGASGPIPAIAFEKHFGGRGMASRFRSAARSALTRLKYRRWVHAFESRENGTAESLELRPATQDSVSLLDDLYRKDYRRSGTATAVRSPEVWKAVLRERRVLHLEAVRRPGTPADSVGYAVFRTLDEELFVEEVVAQDEKGLLELIGGIEQLGRTSGKRLMRTRGRPAHLGLSRRRVGHSAWELRYVALLRPFEGMIQSLSSPHGSVAVRDDFLDRTYSFGDGPSVMEVSLMDLTEYLWGTMATTRVAQRVKRTAESGNLASMFRDLRRRNALSRLDLPYLELY